MVPAAPDAFAYNAEQREALLETVRGYDHIDKSWLPTMETIAREHLGEYLIPQTTLAGRRRHYKAVAKAAKHLFSLLDDRTALEGGSASYLVDGCGMRGEKGFPTRFKDALNVLARRADEWGETGYLPGAEELEQWAITGRTHIRSRMAVAMLQATRIKPTTYKQSPAVKLLMAAINPTMRFARQELGAHDTHAAPLTEDTALVAIRNAKQLLGW